MEKALTLEGTKNNERLHNVLIVDLFMMQDYERSAINQPENPTTFGK